MKKNRWLKDYFGWNGFDYVHLKCVPMRKTAKGPALDLESEVLERLVAKAIVANRIPLRGREVQLLRKAMGLSFHKFAAQIGLTGSTVLHWEALAETRLLAVNEIAVRALAAETLMVEIPGYLSSLLGRETKVIEIVVSDSIGRVKKRGRGPKATRRPAERQDGR